MTRFLKAIQSSFSFVKDHVQFQAEAADIYYKNMIVLE